MRKIGLLLVAGVGFWACTVPNDDLPIDDQGAGMGGMGGGLLMGGTPGTGTGGAGLTPGSGGATPGTGGVAVGTGGMGGDGTVGTGGDSGVAGMVGTGGMVTGTGGTVGTGGVIGTGGIVANGGTPGTGGSPEEPLPMDTARFNFEQSIQNWRDLAGSRGYTPIEPIRSTDRSLKGSASLRYDISVPPNGVRERVVGVAGKDQIGPLPVGSTVSSWVWVPEGHKITSLQAFMQTRTAGTWVAQEVQGTNIASVSGAWTQLSVKVPQSYEGKEPLELGIRVEVSGAWTGSIFIDSVQVE